MDKHEVFATVVRHLVKQGRQSVLSDGTTCAYRGAGGTRCAVGVLIPDELYDPNWETVSVAGIAEMMERTPFGDFLNEHLILLEDLQTLHDVCLPVLPSRPLEPQLRRVAKNHDINTDVLDELFGKVP